MKRADLTSERGSAVVEFVLVGAMTTVLALGVLQLAFLLYVRNTVVDAAGEGARYATLGGNGPEDGARRTRELIGAAVGDRFAVDVHAEHVSVPGAELVRVTVACPMTLVASLLPVDVVSLDGFAVRLDARGSSGPAR